MNVIEQEAIELRSEHRHISGKLSSAQARLEKPRRLRRIAADLAWMVLPAQQAIDAYPKIIKGPKLVKLEQAYDLNIELSRLHLETNFVEYTAMAQADMATAPELLTAK